MSSRAWALLLAAALAVACARSPAAVPAVEDEPVTEAAAVRDLVERVPGYGVVVGRGGPLQLEVNIEADDAPKVAVGQEAWASLPSSPAPIPCRVARVLRGASVETGQAVAWLEPRGGAALAANEFGTAEIAVGARRRTLTVPQAALLVREGKSFVVRAEAGEGGKTAYKPVEVEPGLSSGGLVEVRSGLAAGDKVAVQGALGLLTPDFKAGAND